MRRNKRATSYYNTKTNKYAVVDKGQVKVYDVTRHFGQTVKRNLMNLIDFGYHYERLHA